MTIGMYGGSFYPFHTGHLSMMLKASTLVDHLYIVISFSKEREKITSQEDSFPYISERVRQRWISESVSHLSNVTVLSVEDVSSNKENYDWKKGADDIKQAIGKPIDVIFGSEESYRPIFLENYPNATYACIDPLRKEFPISSTEIRQEGAHKHWQFIPKAVRPFFVKKIVIVGTESCGKSTLVRNLAAYFSTNHIEEFGRTFTDEIGGSNGILLNEDFFLFASHQKFLERYATFESNKFLFVDSEAIVTQYYSHLYGEGHYSALDSIISEQNYDLILFLEPDVPWIQDGTRHHGEDSVRLANNTLLKNLFDEYQTSFIPISGTYNERFQKCIQLIENTFN